MAPCPRAACYRQAELHRVLGDCTAAEDAYRQASRSGLEPQPGLSLLRLAQGKIDVAEAAIRRVVAETSEGFRRAQLFPAQVEIMLAVGDTRAARHAADELTGIAERYDTPALRAVAGHAHGAVLLAEDDARAAVVVLRGAWPVWRELEAPSEAARVRVLVGLGCRTLGDEETATMELDAPATSSPGSARSRTSSAWRRSIGANPPPRGTPHLRLARDLGGFPDAARPAGP